MWNLFTRHLMHYLLSIQAKVQMSEHKIHSSKEAQMTSLNDAKEKELALLKDEETKLDMELATLSGQLDFLAKQVAEFEAEQKRSRDMKVDSEEVQRDIAELKASKEGKTKDAEASTADLAAATKAFEDASKAAADANAEKLENDKATAEVLEPAVKRKADAIKMKEKLAGEVVELQKSIEVAAGEIKEAVASSEAKLAAKSGELEDQKAKLEKARADLDALKEEDAAALSARSGELDEYREFAKKFEAATVAERNRLELLKSERIDARVAQLEKRRSDLGAIEDAQDRDLKNLRELLAYIREMKKKKAAIEGAKIVFDENGDEVEEKEGGGYDDRDDMVNEAAGSPAVKRG